MQSLPSLVLCSTLCSIYSSAILVYRKILEMADDDWDDAPAKAVDVMALGGMEPAAELPEIKLFGKWSCDEVNVSDMSLQV